MQPFADQVESILAAAVDIESAAQRRAFVEHACGGDAGLKRRVEELIENHFRAGGFLESPAPGLGRAVEEPAGGEGPGTVIGPYKLLEPIGEGGMGVVWMAEQREPVRRTAALKVIKPGMDTRRVLARFEAERQALALMDHPHIATVLDAGATPEGRPYFVMELVKGVPITRYCDENRLTPRARLGLFIPVCQALQHAHQKGIMHRDIKPGNVLVARYDGRPVVKVIDFGVAKAAGQPLTERTLFTGFGAVVGTLEYMSPERAEFNALDIDTRSDVYGLGVLLYELLTGTTPLSRKRLTKAAITEALRLIREEEPPRPSTRLTQSQDTLGAISAQRKTEPAKLTWLVRGELDWIIMKALEKDRNRRYDSANSFAQDVQHYLGGGTVSACPPSVAYRLRKFAHRRKVALATSGVVVAALLLGTAISAWQAVQATDARRLADDRLASEKLARAAAVESARQAEEQRRRVDANMILALRTLNLAYDRREGVRYARGESWAKSMETDIALYEECAREASAQDSEELRLEMGKANLRLGGFYLNMRRWNRAVAPYLRGIETFEKLVEHFPTVREYRRHLGDGHNNLAWLLSTTGDENLRDPEKAIVHAKRAVELDPLIARYRNALGAAHYRAGDPKAALGALQKSVELSSGGTAYDFFFQAMAHRQVGQKEEARAWYDRAVEWMEKNAPRNPQRQNEELHHFRAEARVLLGIPENMQPKND